jgi:hypothetical protein
MRIREEQRADYANSAGARQQTPRIRRSRPRVRSLRLQVPAAGCSILLRPGAIRVAGTEPHAAKLPNESVVAAGDPALKAGGTAKHPFPYRVLRDGSLYVPGPTLDGASRYSGCMPTGQRESELRRQARRINREIDAALGVWSPGMRCDGSILKRSGSFVQALRMNSEGVSPRRVLSLRA